LFFISFVKLLGIFHFKQIETKNYKKQEKPLIPSSDILITQMSLKSTSGQLAVSILLSLQDGLIARLFAKV